MRDWQIQIWLKFIAKGGFLAARVFYEMAVRENKRRKAQGLGS